MKHFNQTTVKGVLHEFTRKTSEKKNGKRRFLELVVNCPHPQYGNVRVFGRLWGDEKVKSFMESFRNGDSIKLVGNMAQYRDKSDEVKTNFSFFSFEPWDPSSDKHPHKRATFIFQGEAVSFDDSGREARLSIKVRLENDSFQKEDVFELSAGKACDAFTAPEPGNLVRVKGRIIQDEDEYGDIVIPSRPVIEELAPAGKGKGDAGNASR